MSSDFDAYAQDYEKVLNRGLRLSGESHEYFARHRAQRLQQRMAAVGHLAEKALDFGCGTGAGDPILLAVLKLKTILGVDPSKQSIVLARTRYGTPAVHFKCLDEYSPKGDFDLVFTNGVFHHIPVGMDRDKAVVLAFDSLRPGGIFSFWENNPWNPGTRFIMRRIPFDREAVTLSGWEARTLLVTHGFQFLALEYYFIFPRLLRKIRWLESPLRRVPFGAQYHLLARKPMKSPEYQRDA